eukprot:11674840-Alexandrium_andersonii.AAC.1
MCIRDRDCVAKGLSSLIDWAAPRFRDLGQPTLCTVASAIAMEVIVPVDYIVAAARQRPTWPSGRPRFVVEGSGAD